MLLGFFPHRSQGDPSRKVGRSQKHRPPMASLQRPQICVRWLPSNLAKAGGSLGGRMGRRWRLPVVRRRPLHLATLCGLTEGPLS